MSKINYEDLKYKLERCKNISLDEIDRDTIPELSELKVAKKEAERADKAKTAFLSKKLTAPAMFFLLR